MSHLFYICFNVALTYLFQDRTIRHENTGQCLQKSDTSDVNLPLLRHCDYSLAQQWIMKSAFKWQAHKTGR